MEYAGPQVHFHTDNSTYQEGIQADGANTRCSVMASAHVLRASGVVLGLLV